MTYDEILTKLGEFGTYQKRILFSLIIPFMLCGGYMMIAIVILYTPKHRCKIPGLDNDTYAIQDDDHRQAINMTIPLNDDPTILYDQCKLYTSGLPGSDISYYRANRSIAFCTEWVYDKSVFHDTFTSKANFVCSNSMKIAHIMMLFYFGVLVGDFAFGTMADMVGRKTAIYVGCIILILSSIGVTFAREFYSFAILMVITGGCCHGVILCIYVLCMELVGRCMRVETGTVLQAFFAIGTCYLTLMAYLIREWKWINLSVAIPCLMLLFYWFIIPESPRWLISKGRFTESADIIRKAATVNHVVLPESLSLTNTDEKNKENKNILHVLKSPVLLKRTLILAFNWCIVSMTYYGVTMNTGNMVGSFYLNFFLMAVAEFPSYIFCLVLLDRIGRRWADAICMIVGGLACLATLPVVLWGGEELQPLIVFFSFIGKTGASGAFAVAYIFTAELLPTVVRNAAMGTCSCAARIGAMLAPYIAKSGELIGGKFGQVEPLVVFGALSIISGLMLFLLPETLKQVLPDSIEEGENFGTKQHSVRSEEEEMTSAFIVDKHDKQDTNSATV